LAKLQYHDENGHVIDTLLRDPEVVHLQDVAKLIEWLGGMTTMMYAPVIFAYIAVMLLVTTFLFFTILLWFIKCLESYCKKA
jgi:hypothetical protein